jgi:hypothetical protein
LLLLAMLLLSLCDAAKERGGAAAEEVTLEGLLLLGYHDSRLQDRVRPPGSLECAVFVAFPGTPPFLTPGYDWEHYRGGPRMTAFSLAYQDASRRPGFRPKRVMIRGTLIRRTGFRFHAAHRGNGFGYRGVYPAAILVKAIEFAP